jgi:hypothetical protein
MPNYNTALSTHSTDKLASLYEKADDEFIKITEDELSVFRQLINLQFADISKVIRIDFVDYEPYGQHPSLEDMMKDFRKGVMKIHTTGNDSRIWGKFHNLQFRAIHDYLHLVHELDFSHYDERKVYPQQFQFSLQDRYAKRFPYLNWEVYKAILRSEIVYQSAYKEALGAFHIDQKIILKEL